MRRVAVLGAGFAGLAVSWFLLQRGSFEVTLFDRQGPAAGASGTSAGLLHPYTGPEAKLAWNGLEAFAMARQLIQQVAPQAIRTDGILRLAVSDKQAKSFFKASQSYDNVQWIEDCRALYAPLAPFSGILLTDGVSVQCQLYLECLWKQCELCGAQFRQEEVTSLSTLGSFDQVVVALGAQTAELPELSHLKLRQVKGQILRLKWPDNVPPLPLSITGHAYIVPGHEAIIGATYEKPPFTSDSDFAEKELFPKACAMIPALQNVQIVSTQSGLRAVLPGHLPLLEQIGPRTWVLTGLGSKGLLYHAWLAAHLAQSVS